MDRDPAGQVQVTLDEAKRLLVEGAPAPADVLLRDPAELIRAHPKESIALAAALGLVLGASPRLRRGAIDVVVSVASVVLK